MSDRFEIRVCTSCGLRYPRPHNHPFGTRCPTCLGETSLALVHPLPDEPPASPAVQGAGRLSVLLDNIRSGWNVGAILRTADGFGVGPAYLCGITPTPDRAEVQKTALGAQDSVPWEHHPDGLLLARELKERGTLLLALEQTPESRPIHAATDILKETAPAVLVLGNEISGVDPEILALADVVLHIDMHGSKRSLNVAVAFGVAAASLLR